MKKDDLIELLRYRLDLVRDKCADLRAKLAEAERERDEARAKLGAGVDKVYYESVVEIRHLLTESGIDADDKSTPDRVALLIADRDSLRTQVQTERECRLANEAELRKDDAACGALRAKLGEAERRANDLSDRYARALGETQRGWDAAQATLTRYAELESAARVAVSGVGSVKDLAAVLEVLSDTGPAVVPEHNECDECDHERCITRKPGFIVAHCDSKLRLPSALSALTPAPGAEPTPKPDTCGECSKQGLSGCRAQTAPDDFPACPAFEPRVKDCTRRLPVVAPDTCGVCLYLDSDGDCGICTSPRYLKTPAESDTACPAFAPSSEAPRVGGKGAAICVSCEHRTFDLVRPVECCICENGSNHKPRQPLPAAQEVVK